MVSKILTAPVQYTLAHDLDGQTITSMQSEPGSSCHTCWHLFEGSISKCCQVEVLMIGVQQGKAPIECHEAAEYNVEESRA